MEIHKPSITLFVPLLIIMGPLPAVIAVQFMVSGFKAVLFQPKNWPGLTVP
jgi:hypothetical protein